jgi:hypothetical protein
MFEDFAKKIYSKGRGFKFKGNLTILTTTAHLASFFPVL